MTHDQILSAQVNIYGARQDKETMRTNRLWRYTVGLSPRLAEAVVEENDTRFSIDVSVTRSRRFLLLTSASETTSAARFLPAAEPQGMAFAMESASWSCSKLRNQKTCRTSCILRPCLSSA